MRILVHEFVTGGGLAGRAVPASLAREGLAMRTTLVADLAALRCHDIVTTTDTRFRRAQPPGVECVDIGTNADGTLDTLIASADAVWAIAPETGGCLERLARRVERSGATLLGSGSAVVRRAADKTTLPRRLGRAGVRHPETLVLTAGHDAPAAARQLGYPVVVKPGRGAGGAGVRLVRTAREVNGALDEARLAGGAGALSAARRVVAPPVVMQRFVFGVPASVALVADGRTAVALAVNAQRMSASSPCAYRGGCTPLDHRFADAAIDAAVRACAALPGLRGYVGVDLVLSDDGPFVIEVNPRLTTAYLGVRAVLDENVAALALAACEGMLPAPPIVRRRVRFTAAGLVAAA